MTASEILEKWAEYTNYDENQTEFKMFSSDLKYHFATERMKMIMEFDPSGTLAIIYAKTVFKQVFEESHVNAFEVISNPSMINDAVEMWKMFTSEDVSEAENHIVNMIDDLVRKVTGKTEIGERDIEQERKSLHSSVSSVVDEMRVLRRECYLTSGLPIGKITNFSTHIHVFKRMSECAMTMESKEVADGMYLCFIRNDDTADCFFCFVIKSNGNILSITERIPERFPSQHNNSRNNRWSNDKAYNLFPYDYVFSFDNYDYLGYSTTQIIDESKLAFLELGANVYIPLLLAMVCLSNKFEGFILPKEDLLLCDTLLKNNIMLPSPACTDLIVPSGSAIAERSMNYVCPFTTSEQMKEFKKTHTHDCDKKIRSNYTGVFPKEDNIFEQLYGDGFELDKSKLLQTDPQLRLSDKTDDKELPNAEFIGEKDNFDLICYKQAREQMAAYIRKQMVKELIDFGGAEAVDKWIAEKLSENKDKILKLCAEKSQYISDGGTINVTDFCSYNTDLSNILNCIGMENESKDICGMLPYNKKLRNSYGNYSGEVLDMYNGAKCSIVFTFKPRTWNELEELFGEVPKVLKGWQRWGHRTYGNSLLEVTDAVSGVGSLFEYDELHYHHKDEFHCRYWQRSADDKRPLEPVTDFTFKVAFSKRGLKQLLKEVSK